MSDSNLPDIDAGLDNISEEKSVADLMREKGQKKRVKVMKQSALRDFIDQALTSAMARGSAHISDQARQKIMDDAEKRVQEMAKRASDAERERERLAAETRGKDQKLATMMAEMDLAQEQKDAINELRQRLAAAERDRDGLRADLQVAEQDTENMRHTFEASVAKVEHERQALSETMRTLTMRTGELVQGVMQLDHDLYEDRHQNDNPVPEEAQREEVFFHDFTVAAQVITTLSGDLQAMREGMQQLREKLSSSEAEASAKPSLLASDLQLLQDLKSGSLTAVDVAAPVENLIEALRGAADELRGLQDDTAAQGPATTASIADPPAADGEPAEVLAGANRVVRQMAAALAGERRKVAALAAGRKEEQNLALREQMVRASDLVQAVLSVDNEHYAGRHQEQNTPPESDDPRASFYNDYLVGEQVMATLSTDLGKLKNITAALKEATGKDVSGTAGQADNLDRELELLHQFQQDSLKAMDVAAPVGNLVAALDGVREETLSLQSEAAGAMGVPQAPAPAELPEELAAEPAAVLAAATQVTRQLATAIAAERKRVAGLKALAEQADAARAASDEEAVVAQQANAALCEALAARAEAVGVVVPAALRDTTASETTRIAAAREVLA